MERLEVDAECPACDGTGLEPNGGCSTCTNPLGCDEEEVLINEDGDEIRVVDANTLFPWIPPSELQIKVLRIKKHAKA
jgi:hypothetical protein